MKETELSPHFSYAEATVTQTGLDNSPNAEQLTRIKNTALNMEIVRAVLHRKPIKINSWFRSAGVNSRVGGSSRSEHLQGAAVDFVCPSFGSAYFAAKSLILYAHIINYNQLIYEQTWVHISFPPDGQTGKREVLTYRNGKYLPGVIQ